MPSSPSLESLINTALKSVKQRNSELTKRDLLSTIHHYRGLYPKADKFVCHDGVNRDMINIVGTIPVPYKGANYNIPVSIWILDSHPYHAPLCYVKPTSDMQIKVSQHVDQSGKIYLPYLHEWSYPNSDLLGLIQILIVTFSEQPPVYSKPKEQQQQAAQQQQPAAQASLPYPAYSYQNTSYSSPYPGGYNPTGAYAFPSHPPPQSMFPQQQPTGNYYPAATAANNPEETAKQKTISSVEEKVRASLREEINEKQAVTDELRQVGDKLADGSSKLNSILAKLKLEMAEVEAEVSHTQSKIEEMQADLDRLETAGEVDVDDAVTATVPVFKQLLQAHAEDAAIEDALYFLGESLRRGILDCESYLKHSRNLSRKQFLLRATMLKCRQVGGLRA